MRNSLIFKLIGFLLLCPLSINCALGSNIENPLLSNQLEKILNQNNNDLLKDLFLKKSLKKFNKQFLEFKKNYKNTKWSIKTIRSNSEKTFLDVKITSTRKIGDLAYNLSAKQTIKVETLKNKIKSYKVINEESILNSKDSPLAIKIIAPEKVLTGERYEMNLIIETPLDNSLIASGMIVLRNKENINMSYEPFKIKLNQSGGLFKYIQAPLESGFQTISAIIAHPEGIYLITKKIKVGL